MNTISASSTPIVAKIALVAPFEGLHRPAGYNALAGVRAAIAECSSNDPVRRPPTAYVPLALDDSYRLDATARSLDKIGLDPATAIILGPLSPTLLAVSAAPGGHPAQLPFLIHPDGRFATYDDWPAATAYYIQQVADHLPAPRFSGASGRLLVAGAPDQIAPYLATTGEFPAPAVELLELDRDAPASWLPALQASYAPGDVLLWLWPLTPLLTLAPQLAESLPDLPLILGPDSAALHLTQQATTADDHAAQIPQPDVYWAFWANDAYTTWTQRSTQPTQPDGSAQTPSTVAEQLTLNDWMSYDSYLFYVAACTFVQADAGQTGLAGSESLTESGTEPGSADARHSSPYVGEWALRLVALTP